MKTADIIIACGGTGGHLYPAIAIAEALIRIDANCSILFITRDNEYETTVLKKTLFHFISIPAIGFSRVNMVVNIKLLWILPFGFIKAFFLVLIKKPKIILSTGGYSGVPVLLSAVIQRKKILLQEQNTFPGLTVRFFARFATRIYLGYKEAAQYLSKATSVIETGNPIREKAGVMNGNLREQLNISKESTVIFIFGGSQGSVPINSFFSEIAEKLTATGDITILWQCGKANFATCNKHMSKCVHIFSYIDNIYDFMASSDLAICRAGAMTVAELALFALPAILIPLPSSAGDHQRKNAAAMESRGAAIYFEQSNGSDKLYNEIMRLISDKTRLKNMRNRMQEASRKEAAETIAKDIYGRINS